MMSALMGGGRRPMAKHEREDNGIVSVSGRQVWSGKGDVIYDWPKGGN